MATVTSLFNLFSQHEQRITASLDGFDRGLETILSGLKDAIVDLPYWESTTGKLMLRQIVQLQTQLRGQLTVLGYDNLVSTFMVNGYDAAQLFAENLPQALGKSELMLTPMRGDILQQLRQFDWDSFQSFGNRVVLETSKQLVLNAVGGVKRSTIIKNLQGTLDIKADQASLLADTSLRAFDRQCQWQTADEVGVDLFRYAGPADKKNRPFCAARVGKEFTRKEIGAMSNGSSQFASVKTMMGGPRCRHYWLPIVSPE